jgi:hypothetical protein
MQQSADKGQTAHGSDLHLFRGHVWRGSVGRQAVKDKMSAVVKALQHSSPASRDCSSDVLYGDTGLLPPGVLIDAKLCWQHRCSNMELADGPRRRCDSHSRVAVVSAGLRWARTGAVMSNPLLSRSSTLNIAKVTAQARVNQPCVG